MSHKEILVIKKSHSFLSDIWLIYILSLSENEGESSFSIKVEFVSENERYSENAEDISNSREASERFLYLIAENEVEPCHLHDILYDMLPI